MAISDNQPMREAEIDLVAAVNTLIGNLEDTNDVIAQYSQKLQLLSSRVDALETQLNEFLG